MNTLLGGVLVVLACAAWALIPVLPRLGITAPGVAGATGGLVVAGIVLFAIGIFLLSGKVLDAIRARMRSGKKDGAGRGEREGK